MSWQDIVLAAGSLLLLLTPLKLLDDWEAPPAVSACVPSVIVLAAFAGVYASLDLWISWALTCVNCGAWLALALWSYRHGR